MNDSTAWSLTLIFRANCAAALSKKKASQCWGLREYKPSRHSFFDRKSAYLSHRAVSGARQALHHSRLFLRPRIRVRPGGVIAFNYTQRGTLDKEKIPMFSILRRSRPARCYPRREQHRFKAAPGTRSHRTLSFSNTVTLSPIGCIWPPTPMASG